MTPQEINKAYNRIIGSLDSKELKNAFDFIQSLISGSREYTFQDKLNELQDTYKYMLRYRVEGIKDPMQEQIYNNLQASTYELADAIKHKVLAIESPLAFYNQRRNIQIQGNRSGMSYPGLFRQLKDSHEVNNLAEYNELNIALFNKIWVSNLLSQEESSHIKEIIQDSELPYATGCQVVSALMLGLQAAFDREKLLLLFDAAAHPNEE